MAEILCISYADQLGAGDHLIFFMSQMLSISLEDVAGDNSTGKIALHRLAQMFHSSNKVVALTGAGISVSSGIPVNFNFSFNSNFVTIYAV